ncbi:MAG: transposase [Dehalococcoidia bacterium]
MAKSPKAGESRANKKQRRTSEAIAERVAQARRGRGAAVQATRLAEDQRALDAVETEGISRQRSRALQRRRSKLAARELRLYERDDEAMRQALHRRERLDAICRADHPADGDELLWFLVEELALLGAFEALRPPRVRLDVETGKEVERRQGYPPAVLNLLGVLSRFVGATSNPEISTTVLVDERWMRLLGFTAQEVREGASQRSESLTGKTREGAGGRFVEAGPEGPKRARLEGPRGALSSQTLSGHESDLEADDVLGLFDQVVAALARRGLFGKEVHASLDSTPEEVPPTFEGAGQVRKSVKAQGKARKPRQMKVMVKGFKVWFLMDTGTGLPLSMAFDTIETPETGPARQLVDRARENLGRHGRLASLSIDRGFMDGDLLWWLAHERQIEWVCPGKSKMRVTEEARRRVDEALLAHTFEDESLADAAVALAGHGESYDGVRFFERDMGPGRASLVVAQVDDLVDTAMYGPGGSGTSGQRPPGKRVSLHATVVLRWPDRGPREIEDAEQHDLEPDKAVVLLSEVKQSALERFDRYDDRSLIENRVNRDAKQHFGLGVSLARNANAMRTATVMSTVALMLYRALELHRQQTAEHEEQTGERLGILRYRRQMALTYMNTILIVTCGIYGILPLTEFAEIAGFPGAVIG